MNIWRACEKGYVEHVRKYIDAGKDIEAKGTARNWGLTPLAWASRNGHMDIVELLVSNGANLEARDNNGMTPIIWASRRYENIDVVQFLTKKGANLDAQDNRGMTAIMMATRWRRENIVRFLAESGANVALRDNDGQTVFSIALNEGHLSIGEYLAPLTIRNSDIPYSGASISSFVLQGRQIGEKRTGVIFLKRVIPLYVERAVKDPKFEMDMQRDVKDILVEKTDEKRNQVTKSCAIFLKRLLKILRSIDYTENPDHRNGEESVMPDCDMEL